MRLIALVTALLALGTPAIAQDAPAITFGDVGYGGSGCSDGTALIIKSPDGQAATLVFTEYAVGDNGRALDRKTCAIAVPIDVPAGLQVAVQQMAVRGHNDLPDGVDGTLSVEAFFAGTTGPVDETPLSGNKDFTALTAPAEADFAWSACGADVNLRVNTSLRTKGNADAKVTIRAINLYRLATRAC